MAEDIKKIRDREAKWQKKWQESKVFTPKNDGSKQPFYMLAEFPFPSGTGLHGGHMLNYTGCDVMARFRRIRWGFQPKIMRQKSDAIRQLLCVSWQKNLQKICWIWVGLSI